VQRGPTLSNDQLRDLASLFSQSIEQIDEAKEIEMGKQLAAVLLGAKPLHPNLALQRYVNRLGRWIALQSARPDLPWTFGVLDDAGFNAFAAPGGYVFVTKGLVDALKRRVLQPAGILAHEIQHVVGKHHLKAMRKSAQAGLLTSLIAARLSERTNGALHGQLLMLGKDMYSKGLDQSDELEADRVGVALAARAGFDPYGLVAVLQGLPTPLHRTTRCSACSSAPTRPPRCAWTNWNWPWGSVWMPIPASPRSPSPSAWRGA